MPTRSPIRGLASSLPRLLAPARSVTWKLEVGWIPPRARGAPSASFGHETCWRRMRGGPPRSLKFLGDMFDRWTHNNSKWRAHRTLSSYLDDSQTCSKLLFPFAYIRSTKISANNLTIFLLRNAPFAATSQSYAAKMPKVLSGCVPCCLLFSLVPILFAWFSIYH